MFRVLYPLVEHLQFKFLPLSQRLHQSHSLLPLPSSINLSRPYCRTVPLQAKLCSTAEEAIGIVPNGSSIFIGGFGLCGIPENSIRSLVKQGSTQLTLIAGTCSSTDKKIGLLLVNRQVDRIISSYVGENKHLEDQYWSGQLEVDFVPMGTFAERIRAKAAGIPAFYTPTGYSTQVQFGGIPMKYDASNTRTLVKQSLPKEERAFHGKNYILEEALGADFGFIRAWKADRNGNVQFRATANNFNQAMCKAANKSIVEVEEIVEVGQLDPDHIDVPSIYVDTFYVGSLFERVIERVQLQKPVAASAGGGESVGMSSRDRIARRAALELRSGMYVNLGIGIPVQVSSYIPSGVDVVFHYENGFLGVGDYPEDEESLDADLTNAGKEGIIALPGASFFDSEESFAIIRGGHLNLTMLGAMQVSQYGDLANWMIPEKLAKGMGGAMDLVSSHVYGTRVIVTTEHNSNQGEPKIVAQCSLPLTGNRCVDMIITEKAVFSVNVNSGLTLLEIANDQTVESLKKDTDAPFEISPNLRAMQQVPV